MLENLRDLVKQNSGEAIINNPAIPNEKNDEAVDLASNSIVSGLKNEVSQGNLSDLMSMFNGGEQAATQSAVAQNIQGGFVESLVRKFGLDQGKASGIAGMLIPLVLKKFVNKTNDPNDKSFDLQDIIGSLTAGGASIGGKDILGSGTENDGGIIGKVKGLT
ncbi:MAG TPA: DUF937 domain-containing protein [Segetibacter sp.]|jgi:hypothetical protein